MLRKLIAASAVALLLSACGGHKFEGEFQIKAMGIPGGTLVIGSDYIEKDGVRNELDKIFERESSDGKKYLVMVNKQGQEEAWEIVDDNTLKQSVIKMVRVGHDEPAEQGEQASQ